MSSGANKTQKTSASVSDFLDTVSELRRADSLVLIDMMREISNHEPVMWGTSIIGYDTYHYKYDSGREGDVGVIGFSPRKASLSIYINDGFDAYGELLSRLGKHKTSVVCLYINKLSDVNLDVLREIITLSYKKMKAGTNNLSSVEDYQHNLPAESVAHFKELRKLAKQTLPEAQEVISYAIPAYKIGNVRPIVFISGWKDHTALYPIPSDPSVRAECKPYIKGKGTLWFPLDKPLPRELIKKVMLAHLYAHKERINDAR